MFVTWGSLVCALVAVLVLWEDEAEASHSKLRILVPQRINLIHHHRKTVQYAKDYSYGDSEGVVGGKHHFSQSCKRHRRPGPRHRRKSLGESGYARGFGPGHWQQHQLASEPHDLRDRDGAARTSGPGLRSLDYVPELRNYSLPHLDEHAAAARDAPPEAVQQAGAQEEPAVAVGGKPRLQWNFQGSVGRPPLSIREETPSRDLGSLGIQLVRNNAQVSTTGLELYPPLSPQKVPHLQDTSLRNTDYIPDTSGGIPRDESLYGLEMEHDQGMIFGKRNPKTGGATPDGFGKLNTGEASSSFYSFVDNSGNSQSGTSSRGGARTRRRHGYQRRRPVGQPTIDNVSEASEQDDQSQADISDQPNRPTRSSSGGDSTPLTRMSKSDDVYYQAFRAFSYRTSRASTTAPGTNK